MNIEEEAMSSNWSHGGTQQELKGKGGVNMLKIFCILIWAFSKYCFKLLQEEREFSKPRCYPMFSRYSLQYFVYQAMVNFALRFL